MQSHDCRPQRAPRRRNGHVLHTGQRSEVEDIGTSFGVNKPFDLGDGFRCDRRRHMLGLGRFSSSHRGGAAMDSERVSKI